MRMPKKELEIRFGRSRKGAAPGSQRSVTSDCALQKNSSRTSATGHKRPFCNRRPRLDFHYASSATNLARHCDMSRRANLKGALKVRHG